MSFKYLLDIAQESSVID